MAKCIYGSIVTELRGSIGGNVFSRTFNGNYVKRKSTNINKNSLLQQERRNAFANVTGTWRTLSPTEMTTWNTLAAVTPYVNSLGVTSYYSGFQLFSKYNNALLAIGQNLVTSAPLPAVFDNVVWNQCSFEFAGQVMLLTLFFSIGENNAVPGSDSLQVFATRSLSAGVGFPKDSAYKLITTLPSGTNVVDYSLNDEYTAVFGQLPLEGSNVYWRVKLVNASSGQAGVPASCLMSLF